MQPGDLSSSIPGSPVIPGSPGTHVCWRLIHAARNSYAALYAACEKEGIILAPAKGPRPGITVYSLNSLNEKRYRKEIRDADSVTIVGGPHATACYESVSEYADYVVVGEGEFALPALIRHITEGRTGKIPGTATREGYVPAEYCVRLDAYPPFSHMKGYVEISRGCPFRCGYCQTPRMFGHRMRHRSLDSIALHASRYRDARFVTPNALAYGSDGTRPRLEKVEALLKRLDNNIYFGTFPSEVRPEFVTDAALDLVTTYCANTRLHFGGQSGSDRVLRELLRGHSAHDTMTAVDRCHEHGIIPVVDFIVGFPFESDEEQRETARAIREVCRGGKVHVHRFIPLPGTPLAGARPRKILPEIDRCLGSLSLHGKLTGSWGDPQIRFCS
ncbi:B12-binding domain/radical SAM domain protein [Methanolinea mesophila]|uniref:TIGR04013 family B12-binding domain/radical SAM domain-containing protein n=1 Tax=Methanolinea mesophila TaxID=547055 RepID=UPI001AE5E0C4|nr:TIGR04013 family B12-binding domain/radical SAM domain-containing protein [Methanolinea mesophila]MBP1927874.1 B12-binding domain/radical SAM domain protein [Methanolinea mesophila]